MTMRALRRTIVCIASTIAWLATTAHVGTNQVVFEGMAGGYPLRVMIAPPGVVPAQVPITVRVLGGTPARLTVRAAQWNVGLAGAPPAEELVPVPGTSDLYAHELWIMTSSTYAVHVAVEGAAGAGELVVPMQSSSTRTLGMHRAMGAVLAGMGSLLFVGLVAIVGAAVREGSLPAGVGVQAARARKARAASLVAAVVLAVAILGGARWWRAEESAYRRSLYRPIASDASIRSIDDTRQLRIAITDSLWQQGRYSALMPDHGKLMHLFLVRVGDADVIAHLHPVRTAPDSFTTALPPIPDGRYALFADILLQSGAQRTLVDTIDVPVQPVVADDDAGAPHDPVGTTPPLDRDDAWERVVAVAPGRDAPVPGGGAITLRIDGDARAAADLRLLVTLRNAAGEPQRIEPYMGMAGHAMVYRRDGGIFMHIHPAGTESLAAQAQLLRRERGDTARLDSAALANALADALPRTSHELHGLPQAPGTVAFPFAFPTAGDYRVFVQVKIDGVVRTAAFDVVVAAAR